MDARLDPADKVRRRTLIDAHLAGETPFYELEYRVRDASGRTRWIRARGKCVRDAAGKPVRFAGSVSDIDEKKSAEEKLRTSEERYAIAITGSHEGHWVWDLASDEVHTSRLLNELFGLPLETEVIGMGKFFAHWPVHAEDRPRLDAQIAEHLAGKMPRLDVEYRVVSKTTGQVRWVHSRAMLFRDADGKPLRMGGATVEVTERRLAEEALRRSDERYQLAVAGSNEGLWDWDLKSDMLFLSPRA